MLLCVLAAPAGAQDQQALAFTEAINQALAANRALASARESVAAQQENIDIARANFLPTVTVPLLGSVSESATFSESRGVIPSRSLIAGVAASQLIYSERAFAAWDIEKALVAAQQDQFEGQRQGVIAGAGQAYLGVLLEEALLQTQVDNLELTRENLAISEAREQAGAGTYQEVLRLQSQEYANQQHILAQRSNLLASRFAFNQVRAQPLEDTTPLEELTVEGDGFIFASDVVVAALADAASTRRIRDFLVQQGLAGSPALRALDREIEAQTRQLTSNRRWLLPSASFSAGADAFIATGGDQEQVVEEKKWFWKLGATMVWTPFDGAASPARVRQASAQLQALRLQRMEVESSLEQSIRASATVAMTSYQTIGLAEAQLETATRGFELARDSYLEGEAALVSLLDAQEQVLAANASLVAARYTFLSDLLNVERAMGYFPFLQPPDQVEALVRALEAFLEGH